MQIRLAAPCTRYSAVDGPGLRLTVWFQGCRHQCPGCHNPLTHDFHGGFLSDTDTIVPLLNDPALQGITLSGGDPMEQPEACLELAKAAKALHKDVWLYTGYPWEKIVERKEWEALLNVLDVLVEGPFKKELADPTLPFRGSSNQRILKLKEEK